MEVIRGAKGTAGLVQGGIVDVSVRSWPQWIKSRRAPPVSVRWRRARKLRVRAPVPRDFVEYLNEGLNDADVMTFKGINVVIIVNINARCVSRRLWRVNAGIRVGRNTLA